MSDQTVNNIERKLDGQLSKVNREKMTTLVIYTILVIIIFGYTFWLRGQTNELTGDSVVEVVIGTAQEKIPEARSALKEQFVDNADQLLNDQADKLVELIPAKRQELETYAKSQVAKSLLIAQENFGELFQNTLQAGRAELEPMLEQIENAQSQEDFEEAFYKALKVQLNEPSLVANIAAYGDALSVIADRMEFLRTEPELTESELMEKEIMMCLRSVALRAEKAN